MKVLLAMVFINNNNDNKRYNNTINDNNTTWEVYSITIEVE